MTSICYYQKYCYAVQTMYAHVNVMISVELYIETKGAEVIRYHKIDQGIKSDFKYMEYHAKIYITMQKCI